MMIHRKGAKATKKNIEFYREKPLCLDEYKQT